MLVQSRPQLKRVADRIQTLEKAGREDIKFRSDPALTQIWQSDRSLPEDESVEMGGLLSDLAWGFASTAMSTWRSD